jgi:hypothetical protein
MHYAGLSGRVECGEWLRKEKHAEWPKTIYDEAIVNREAVMRCWSLPFVQVRQPLNVLLLASSFCMCFGCNAAPHGAATIALLAKLAYSVEQHRTSI